MSASETSSSRSHTNSAEVGEVGEGAAKESSPAGLDPSPRPQEPNGVDGIPETSSDLIAPSSDSSLVQDPPPSQYASDHRKDLRTLDATDPSEGKKRASSRLSSHASTPSGPPPTKRLHQPHRSPHRTSSPLSHRSPRQSSSDQAGQGPLFFSDNQTPRRPTLPYRMSSSDAAARMLNKGNKEDTGGVRTLKLARGPANTHSAARPSSQRTPSGSGRSHLRLSKSRSPDEGNLSGASTMLRQMGVIELLEQDDRPTFVLDLTDVALFEPGPLRILFANASLRAVTTVFDNISGKTSLDSPSFSMSTSFSDFKSWTTSYVQDQEPLDVVLPTFSYAGASWTCSGLKKRFRVFRGIPFSPRTTIGSNATSMGLPSASPAPREYDSTHGDSEEFQDYFGKVSGSLAPGTSAKKQEIDTEKKAKGLKISKLTQPGDLPRTNSRSPSSNDDLLSTEISGNLLSTSNTPHAIFPGVDIGFFDWTRMADSPALPSHIRFARSIDWASTSLGPIDGWSSELRSMCNLIMASPHPAAMYWGKDFVAIYNEAYIYLAGPKHPKLMGQSYQEAWPEIWDNIREVFDAAVTTGESTMKEDDCLFIQRATTDGRLEEAWFDWSIIPLVGGNGSVVGLYNPAFEKTKRKVGERRTGTLSSVGERTSTAKDLRTFWKQIISGLESNVYDVPFALLYSVSEDIDSDSQESVQAGDHPPVKECILEGKIGVPDGHPAAKSPVDLRDASEYYVQIFKDAAAGYRPIVLSVEKGTLDPELLKGMQHRGHQSCSSAICCPVQSTRNETLGYLLMGLNPRRPYDDDYSTFIQMLSRQISTAMASVVLFEEEIRAGMKAKRRADIARIELSQQLAVQTQAAVETERKFTQMARFAPVGIFIANSEGAITYRNQKWNEILKAPTYDDATYQWLDAIKDDDRDKFLQLWSDLVHNGVAMNTELRFKTSWVDRNGNAGDTWALASGYPEKDDEGRVKVIYGSITDISQQKWAELFEKRRMEQAVEMKRQQENFIDITSHEMRNPLSAILQCADDISTSLGNFKANNSPASSTDDVTQNAIDSAGIISLCAQHQKRIVDDILTLSKLDSALLLVTPCDVMPKMVVQRALRMFDGEVQTADIKLDFTTDESIDRLGIEWVKMDPSRLLQVLINLTTNAIKFTTASSKRVINVTFAASLDTPSGGGRFSYVPARSKNKDLTKAAEWGDGEEIHLHFAVTDTGRGLSEDEKKLLFLRFSQASPRTHVQYGGSGLGLFISRELVELQGGEIGVASTAGEGSTFAFYIKARRSTAPENGAEEFPTMAPRKPSASHKALAVPSMSPIKASAIPPSPDITPPESSQTPPALRVLVVEDNLVNQRVLVKQLQKNGVLVLVANHGGECLDRLKETSFWAESSGENPVRINAILMDQEMPVMDGLTCTKVIREMEAKGEIKAHVPIVAVTANARKEQIDTIMSVGMVSLPS